MRNGQHSNENKRHPFFATWRGIVSRCESKTHPEYSKYGGAGVALHPAWREDMRAFSAYLGPKPSATHSVDRHPNNAGNYEPGNVRWATPAEQVKNRRKFKSNEGQERGEIPDENREALAALLAMFSDFDIAKMLGISRQPVHKWEEVPIRTVARLAVLTGIRPEILHPNPYY